MPPHMMTTPSERATKPGSRTDVGAAFSFMSGMSVSTEGNDNVEGSCCSSCLLLVPTLDDSTSEVASLPGSLVALAGAFVVVRLASSSSPPAAVLDVASAAMAAWTSPRARRSPTRIMNLEMSAMVFCFRSGLAFVDNCFCFLSFFLFLPL